MRRFLHLSQALHLLSFLLLTLRKSKWKTLCRRLQGVALGVPFAARPRRLTFPPGRGVPFAVRLLPQGQVETLPWGSLQRPLLNVPQLSQVSALLRGPTLGGGAKVVPNHPEALPLALRGPSRPSVSRAQLMLLLPPSLIGMFNPSVLGQSGVPFAVRLLLAQPRLKVLPRREP